MAIYADLAGKNVVITGASGDIGLALCDNYLQQKCQVYAIYHSDISGLDEVKSSHVYGENLHLKQCNVSDGEAVVKLAAELESEFDSLHVLVNNAGICKDNLFSMMEFDEFDQVMKVNMYGTFHMCKQLLRPLRHARNAAIVNVSSISSLTASFGQTNYSAAKGAINGFTRTLAAEYAGKGIRVNSVAPGMIDSRMVKKIPRQISRTIISAIPLKRLGNVDEIAHVALFLSSDASSYIVGQTLVADGGLVMR